MSKEYNKEVFKNKSGEDVATPKKVGEISKDEFKSLTEKAEKVDVLSTKLSELSEELETIKSKLGSTDIDDLLKAKKDLEDIKKAKEKKELEDMVEVVKGFNMIEEDAKVEDVAKFLNSNKCEAVDILLKGIETINEQKKSLALEEGGTDFSNQEDSEQQEANKIGNAVSTILKKRGSVKK